jgi:hypothetical protein
LWTIPLVQVVPHICQPNTVGYQLRGTLTGKHLVLRFIPLFLRK